VCLWGKYNNLSCITTYFQSSHNPARKQENYREVQRKKRLLVNVFFFFAHKLFESEQLIKQLDKWFNRVYVLDSVCWVNRTTQSLVCKNFVCHWNRRWHYHDSNIVLFQKHNNIYFVCLLTILRSKKKTSLPFFILQYFSDINLYRRD